MIVQMFDLFDNKVEIMESEMLRLMISLCCALTEFFTKIT